MKFIEKTTLDNRGPIEQLPEEKIDGTFLIGEKHITSWEEGHTQFGNNITKIFPAFHNGEKTWLILSVWESAPGYSCSGLSQEKIISFEEGVKLLLKKNDRIAKRKLINS